MLAIHLGVSKLTGIAEFALDKEEANQLSVAAINVARHYDVGVLSPKVMAWLSLVGVMGAIYVPKMLMTKGRPKKEATQENEPQYFPLAANVVNMQMPPVFTSSVGNGK